MYGLVVYKITSSVVMLLANRLTAPWPPSETTADGKGVAAADCKDPCADGCWVAVNCNTAAVDARRCGR